MYAEMKQTPSSSVSRTGASLTSYVLKRKTPTPTPTTHESS